MNDATTEAKQLETLLGPAHTATFELPTDNGPQTITIEPFTSFKTAALLRLLAQTREKVDVMELVGELAILSSGGANLTDEESVNRARAALTAIPALLQIAPDLLLDFAALALVPTADLEAAYPNTAPVVEAKKKWLEFHTPAHAPIRIFAQYLPHLGVNFMREELTATATAVSHLLKKPKATGS